MEAVILYTCDIWKSWNSAKVVGVYTNIRKLKKQLRKMIKKNVIEIDENCPYPKSLKDWDIRMMQNSINYCILEEINLNKEV